MSVQAHRTEGITGSEGREGANGVGGGVGVGGGNGVEGGKGEVNGHGDEDGAGAGAGTGTGVEMNERAQDGNGDRRGDGDGARAGTGTGVETRRRTTDGNGDGNGDGDGDGSEESSGNWSGDEDNGNGNGNGNEDRIGQRGREAKKRIKPQSNCRRQVGNGGDLGGKTKKCRNKKFGPIAANPDNIESNKEGGGGARSADRGWRLRVPDSSVRKARCLYKRIVPREYPGPRDDKERTGSGAGLESRAGTETVTGSRAGKGT